MKDFISTENLTRDDLEKIFLLADNMVAKPKKYSKTLKNCCAATLFYEPSTRTRISFESAIQKLGGTICSTEVARDSSSGKKGETIEDCVRSLEGYVNLIVIRHPESDAVEKAVKVASVPIVSAGSGSKEHPTQGLVEIYTMRQFNGGKVDGISLAVLGDLMNGRTLHSLLRLVALYSNITVYGYAVKGLELPQHFVDYFAKCGVKYVTCNSLEEIPADVNFIYQTRVQKERIENNSEDFHGIILNKENYARFSPTTYLMHPLPRVDEIDTDLDDDSRAIYFKETHNGLPIRMAICHMIMHNYFKNRKN